MKRYSPEELVGKTFGKWTIIEVPSTKKAPTHVLCECGGCGFRGLVNKANLIHGKTMQCRQCYAKERSKNDISSGDKFGKWTVITTGNKVGRERSYKCQCRCGNESTIPGSTLRHKRSTQCRRCSSRETIKKNIKLRANPPSTHGRSKTRLYKIWAAMKQRCRNPKCNLFHRFGGRGIDYCDRWEDFEAFAYDMGEPAKGMEIDRIDNNKGYYPENCRWTSHFENRSNNRYQNKPSPIEGFDHLCQFLRKRKWLSYTTVYGRAQRLHAKGDPSVLRLDNSYYVHVKTFSKFYPSPSEREKRCDSNTNSEQSAPIIRASSMTAS